MTSYISEISRWVVGWRRQMGYRRSNKELFLSEALDFTNIDQTTDNKFDSIVLHRIKNELVHMYILVNVHGNN